MAHPSKMIKTNYVLITPAKNEEQHIEKTIESVIRQTILPSRWIIVSDGSTDRTDEIANRYAEHYDFIRFIRRQPETGRNFASKVYAFNLGASQVKDLAYDYIGNLDADISMEEDYFEKILEEFQKNPNLGLAGGSILELIHGNFIMQKNRLNSVSGAVQLFRRECYEKSGGYIPMETGCEDSAAEISARMHGWTVRMFPNRGVLHHRRVSMVGINPLRVKFRHGKSHYLLGYHPLFETIKSLYRITDYPAIIGSAVMLAGYFWSLFTKVERSVSHSAIEYIRKEQIDTMKEVLTIPFNRTKRKQLSGL